MTAFATLQAPITACFLYKKGKEIMDINIGILGSDPFNPTLYPHQGTRTIACLSGIMEVFIAVMKGMVLLR